MHNRGAASSGTKQFKVCVQFLSKVSGLLEEQMRDVSGHI